MPSSNGTPSTAPPAPLISVLVPCYNTARYLPAAIDSVLAQTFQNFELILLNDGSTDQTGAVLQSYAARDPRIRTRCRPNKGLIDTRNELLSLARGPFLAWHDSDDTMAPNRLHAQLARMQADPSLVWIGGAGMLTDPEGLPIRSHAFPFEHHAICARMQNEFGCYFGSTLMRHDVVKSLGGFRHPFKVCEDFDLCLRMAELGTVANLPDVVLFYRQHLNSACHSTRFTLNAYAQLARDLAAERRSRPDHTDRLQRGEPISLKVNDAPDDPDQFAHIHRRWAWWALADGHLQTARKYARHALREAPLDFDSWKLMACALRGH